MILMLIMMIQMMMMILMLVLMLAIIIIMMMMMMTLIFRLEVKLLVDCQDCHLQDSQHVPRISFFVFTMTVR